MLCALVALIVPIVLILRKTTPVYALMLGALVGGLVGGFGLQGTVGTMISGAQGMMSAVLRILASGVLAGALVKTGAAERLAGAVVRALGARFALLAVALATALVCAVGVFVDIAVITVAPVALSVGRRAGLPVSALLLAMIGGGKAGNIVSPNPNTISVAEAFKLDLTALMVENAVPALVALATTVLLAQVVRKRAARDATPEAAVAGEDSEGHGPGLVAALAGPVVVVLLLALRPLCGFAVDPLVALSAGGLVCVLAAGRARETVEICTFGLSKVSGIALLLIGTGTIAGVVKASTLTADLVSLLASCHLPAFVLAPLSGVLLAGATASTTAGATVASQSFAGVLLESGVPAISAAAMIHAGATVVDSLPHGSFFHATGGVVGMSVRDRLRLIPYEALVGLSSTLASVFVYINASLRAGA